MNDITIPLKDFHKRIKENERAENTAEVIKVESHSNHCEQENRVINYFIQSFVAEMPTGMNASCGLSKNHFLLSFRVMSVEFSLLIFPFF